MDHEYSDLNPRTLVASDSGGQKAQKTAVSAPVDGPADQESETVIRARRQISESVWLAIQALQDVVVRGNGRERVAAAKEILDRAGIVAVSADRANKLKDLTEMDSGDLATLVNRAQRELADRARPVIQGRNAPNAPRKRAKPLDLLD